MKVFLDIVLLMDARKDCLRTPRQSDSKEQQNHFMQESLFSCIYKTRAIFLESLYW